jgi:hypothetical protein
MALKKPNSNRTELIEEMRKDIELFKNSLLIEEHDTSTCGCRDCQIVRELSSAYLTMTLRRYNG